MPREPRVVAVGVPHHITQKGNNRQDVFLLDEDRRFYLQTLQQQCLKWKIRLLGYCLMRNHVHLVAIPERPESLARGLGQAHLLHSRRFNRRYDRSGHLWQNRFYSCPLGRAHLVQALAYVDLNPVRAKMVPRSVDYPWSSARAHVEACDPTSLLDLQTWKQIDPLAEWEDILRDASSDPAPWEQLRQSTCSGQPWGDESFVKDLAASLRRDLGHKKMGRPPKSKALGATVS